jgi:hypothetical protein
MIVIRGTMDGSEARRRAKAQANGDVHIALVLFETVTIHGIDDAGRRITHVMRTGNRIFNFRTHLR